MDMVQNIMMNLQILCMKGNFNWTIGMVMGNFFQKMEHCRYQDNLKMGIFMDKGQNIIQIIKSNIKVNLNWIKDKGLVKVIMRMAN